MNFSNKIKNVTESLDMKRVDTLQYAIYVVVEFIILISQSYLLAAFSYYINMKK